jgi:hypothetical protein
MKENLNLVPQVSNGRHADVWASRHQLHATTVVVVLVGALPATTASTQ